MTIGVCPEAKVDSAAAAISVAVTAMTTKKNMKMGGKVAIRMGVFPFRSIYDSGSGDKP